jgi:hypothetical protein
VYEEVKAELKLRGGYIMSPEECKKAGATIIKDGRLNAGVDRVRFSTAACSVDSCACELVTQFVFP